MLAVHYTSPCVIEIYAGRMAVHALLGEIYATSFACMQLCIQIASSLCDRLQTLCAHFDSLTSHPPQYPVHQLARQYTEAFVLFIYFAATSSEQYYRREGILL